MLLTTLNKPSVLPDFTALVVDDQSLDLENEPFKIDSDEKALWGSNRFLDAEKRIQERCDHATLYINRINAWLDKANKEDLDSVIYFRNLLKQWLEGRLMGIRGRSLTLPGLKLGFRKRPDRVEIFNAQEALEFCESQVPEAVITKKDISKTELKKVLALGVCVPGAELVFGDDEVSIKEE